MRMIKREGIEKTISIFFSREIFQDKSTTPMSNSVLYFKSNIKYKVVHTTYIKYMGIISVN